MRARLVLACSVAVALCACSSESGTAAGDGAVAADDMSFGSGGTDLSMAASGVDLAGRLDAGIAPGILLFAEDFDDASFLARGWYDGSSGTISSTEHIPGSKSSFQCDFRMGATSCTGGKPARHKFSPSATVYLRFWIKFSANWVGSGKPYHPHMFHFVTDLESDYIGPADTHLTTYAEIVGGVPSLAITDALNSDARCILRNDGSFVGCNGNFATYPFTEQRSVASCNGFVGDLDQHDCFFDGSYWYSARAWNPKMPYFSDTPGPRYKNDWHKVEVVYQMNSIAAGIGVPDGKIRFEYDGEVIISSDRVLFRSGAHPNILFSQFLMLPYIGDGSPIAQTFWIDDLAVGTGLP